MGPRPAASPTRTTRWLRALSCGLALLLLAGLLAVPAHAAKIVLRDGTVLIGRLDTLPTLSDKPRPARADGAPVPGRILMLDDNLRRTYVPKLLVEELLDAESGEALEKFTVWQRISRVGAGIQVMGKIHGITPFDEYGRRTYHMAGRRDVLEVDQGITEITPVWTRLSGITHVWDQRLATSSIPKPIIDKLIREQIDPAQPEQRLKIARFMLQAERYGDARRELEAIVAEFPDVADRIKPQISRVRQLESNRLLREIELRHTAGQYRLTESLLNRFPAEGVAGETLQTVRQRLTEYTEVRDRVEKIVAALESDFAALDDPQYQARLEPILAEIADQVGHSTVDRLAAYERLSSDRELLPSEKLAAAVSGWIVGTQAATVNLPVAVSLYDIRDLLFAYFNEPEPLEREQILADLRASEGATPDLLTAMILHMAPPVGPSEPVPGFAGLYRLFVNTLPDEPPTEYFVQLPPEYDPHRLYPTIVSLHAANTTPNLQIDWWAGTPDSEGNRLGQAGRHGYIVVAPAWAREAQKQPDYSARSHLAVLNTLRDACRRFAVDTDHVYLSGHGMGGETALDVGLAHPDLWAGLIPVSCVTDRYCRFYRENATNLPIYIVLGELDGEKLAASASVLDWMMARRYNVTIVEYLGRGEEHFSDEILRLFSWMPRHRRDFFPREVACQTIRPWDNFFYWVEVEGLPERSILPPDTWPAPRGVRPMNLEAEVRANGTLSVRTGADRVTLWLSPELVEFNSPLNLSVNGRRIRRRDEFVTPDIETIVEDVRTRGDRQHPFWARLDFPPRDQDVARLRP